MEWVREKHAFVVDIEEEDSPDFAAYAHFYGDLRLALQLAEHVDEAGISSAGNA